MNRLEKKHIDFLIKCTKEPNKVHSSDLPPADLKQMADEGLLIGYNRIPPQYAISKYGAQYIKEETARTPGPEMRELAIKYVISKDYSAEEAEQIVDQEGVDKILATQAEEMRHSTQQEVKPPTDDKGNVTMRFKGGM